MKRLRNFSHLKNKNEYCQQFVGLPHSAVAVAYVNNEPVGYISGTSVADFDEHFKGSAALFKSHGLDSKRCYYIPEAIIMPAHRKHSLINKIAALLEQYAKEKGYGAMCCAEESHAQHPLKPAEYHSLDGMFIKGGYSKTGMIIKFPWLTIQADGSLKEQDHALCYWIKNI